MYLMNELNWLKRLSGRLLKVATVFFFLDAYYKVYEMEMNLEKKYLGF